ncbi:UPF0481 protein At3g47200-like [Cornus florida]|uniref:UPF0481 protein At3g47200-like n=1 Tax=Cornus florida TaxID=4283 RepID=UPI00289E8EA4|nr:UPF0481 protein At3g47200-like [Cornus florida]
MANGIDEVVPVELSNMSSHEEWLNSIIDAAEGANSTTTNSASDQAPRRQRPPARLIHKVPQMLGETKAEFEKYYAPRVVSIGPYHHHNLQQLHQMNEFKLIFTRKLVSNDKQKLDGLYSELFQMIKQVRDCYEETNVASFNDEAFTRMMLIDGCFILYFIHCSQNENDRVRVGLKPYHIPFVQQDLFLLENQLPFLVLDELINSPSTILTTTDWMQKVGKFIEDKIMVPQYGTKQINKRQVVQDNDYAHLLELLHKKMVGPVGSGIREVCSYNWYNFRNVKELIEAGIRLKPSKTSFLTDICYERGYLDRHLTLPPITVDDSTKSKFINLIAYEMCPEASDDIWVISYICFLDALVDQAEDVKELRSAGILHNHLGSDHEVATLFNEIAIDLVPLPCAYNKVKCDIQAHYHSKGLNYLAQLKHQHLKNPWTIMGLIAGFILLILTAVQAWFQVWSRPTECDRLCKFIKDNHHI